MGKWNWMMLLVHHAGFGLDAKKVSGWLAYYANKKFISPTHTKSFRTAVSGDNIIVKCIECTLINELRLSNHMFLTVLIRAFPLVFHYYHSYLRHITIGLPLFTFNTLVYGSFYSCFKCSSISNRVFIITGYYLERVLT